MLSLYRWLALRVPVMTRGWTARIATAVTGAWLLGAGCGDSNAALSADIAADARATLEEASSSVSPDVGQNAMSPDAPEMRCNGYTALCDRRFDEVVFPTTHNAMSNSDDGWIMPNQEHGIARQLEDGVRAMMLDTHSFMGGSYLCHSSCILGNKSLTQSLREIATFLRRHPHEVLALIVEDHITARETETAFVESRLADFAYVHDAGSPWPTLRSMIASGKRLLVGAEQGAAPPTWYHHFNDLAWDTPYAFRSASEFSCRENRGKRANGLFLLNHWIEDPLPDENLSRAANQHDLLLSRARKCQMESGKLPNFVAVSHYAVGDLFDVVRELNGL
jgi:hypothetical protein